LKEKIFGIIMVFAMIGSAFCNVSMLKVGASSSLAMDARLAQMIDIHATEYYHDFWSISLSQYKSWIALITLQEAGNLRYAAHSGTLGSDMFYHVDKGSLFPFCTGIGAFQLDRGGSQSGYEGTARENWSNMPTILKIDPKESLLSVLRWHRDRFGDPVGGAGVTLADFSSKSAWVAVWPKNEGVFAETWEQITGYSWYECKEKKMEVNFHPPTINDPFENTVRYVGKVYWYLQNWEGYFDTWLISARGYWGEADYYYTYRTDIGIEQWVWRDPDGNLIYRHARNYKAGYLPENLQGDYAGYTDDTRALDPSELQPEATAMMKGLWWLKNHQNTDGSWQNSVGITSMATLAFLNLGYQESYATISNAIQYILANRHPDGSFGWGTYETSIAVWALVATHNPEYHDEVAQAKDWLILAQYDEGEGATLASPCYGGWRYGSSPSDGDLSNTQFALMALDAAYSELGLEKPDPNDPSSWSFKAVTFISRCQNRPASNDQAWPHDTARPSYNDGGFIYYPGGWSLAGGTDSYGSMTAAGIWSLRLCGVAVTDERVQAGLNWLINNEDCSFDDNPGHPYDQAHCFLYYYYMTIAKALTMCFLHDLGEVDWYAALSARLIQLQYDDGHWVNAPASHGMENIPELATDYALLALQVKQPPPAKLWMSIILASNAELCVYDPQGRHARLDDVTIPGATFEIDEEGRQIVNLTELEAGKYTIELMGIADGDYSLTINGYRDEEQTFSKTFEGTIKKGQTLVGSALVTSMVGALTIYTEKPMLPPDTIPPTTILTIGEPKYVTEVTYVTPDTPFNLNATDNPGGAGVALTAYKIRNATYASGWLTYTEPFYLTGLTDGVYTIDYNSTDNANNVEPTNTINVTLFSWNYVFTDSYGRETTLKINIEHHFFQFITPDNDYGIRNATYMRRCGRAIIIKHYDNELRLITVAIDTKLGFCVAVAWDAQTGKRYFLIDKAGTE
jgi:squalene-hopene/tetraprenyl-beta-curcumene cyclase